MIGTTGNGPPCPSPGRRAGRSLVVLAVSASLLTLAAPAAAEPVITSRVPARSIGVDPIDVALEHLVATVAQVDAPPDGSLSKPGAFSAAEPELRVTSTATSVDGAVTHVYVQQTHSGIDIVGAGANVAVLDGAVVHSPSRLADAESIDGLVVVPGLDEVGAVAAAADALGLVPTAPFTLNDSERTADSSATVSGSGISRSPITVRQVWAADGKDLRLAWEVVIDVADSAHWWQITLDAESGKELDRFDYNIEHSFHPASDELVGGDLDLDAHDDDRHDDDRDDVGGRELKPGDTLASTGSVVVDGSSYRVFPLGAESPLDGPRVLVSNPADDVASPFGWHDANGAAGADSSLTTGNNVDAFTDRDGDDRPDAGSRPNGGDGLDFDFAFDPDADPAGQAEAAVTQLFVSTNFAHDFLYAYGFDEAAGNFQTHNYGRGGTGGDAVLAEAHGTDGRGNANFATPPDGSAPRMQNFFWDGGAGRVDLDGVYDQGVILHEYGHGLSSRLTGGRTDPACLRNREQGGEGWSDYVALMATMDSGDRGSDRRGIGNYVTRQGADGRGIRAKPYSTSQATDPRTYGDIATALVPHGVGSIWAALLWEMTWDLVDEYGLDPDVVNGNGGNNLATQLVVDGLKLQSCNPGFVDARDAILRADVNLTGGDNSCLIWESFARRGLGASARQGSSDDHTDGTEAFDLPTSCPLGVTIEAGSPAASDGAEIGFTVSVENNSLDTEDDIAVTVPLADTLSYVSGSANCRGTGRDGSVRMKIASIDPGDTTTCSFRVRAATGSGADVLDDDFDPGADAWLVSRGTGVNNSPGVTSAWRVAGRGGRSGSNAVFATGDHGPSDTAQAADLVLTLDDPVVVPAGGRLAFWHLYDFEPGYDGGTVAVSTDGGDSWLDLGPDIVTNGYTGMISGADRSPIAGRPAFTGSSSGFTRSVVDLCRFSGQSALFRFRSTTDPSVRSVGWSIDEVTLTADPSVHVMASVATSSGTGVARTCVGVARSPPPRPTPTPPRAPESPRAIPAPRPALEGTARAEARAERLGGPTG